MADTVAEKQTALNNCHECKYKDNCDLLKQWMAEQPKCIIGVK